MELTEFRPDVQAFLKAFFGPGNQFHLQNVLTQPDDKGGYPRLWLAALRGEHLRGTLLPRWVGRLDVRWYGLAFTPAGLEDLRERLKAFVGPTYSDFRGVVAALDLTDPIEQAIHVMTGGQAFRFSAGLHATKSDNENLKHALDLMRRVQESRPRYSREQERPLGRVLRDFNMAVAAGDRQGAENHLAHLREHALLDALNIEFLRIQMLAGAGTAEELLDTPRLKDIIEARRPQAVTQAIVQAYYRRYLESYEAQGQPAQAVARFKEPDLRLLDSLLSWVAGSANAEVAKATMLSAVAKTPPDRTLSQLLLAQPSLADTDREYLRRLASLVPATVEAAPKDPLASALAALEFDDYAAAYERARQAPASLRRAKVLSDCALELQTLDAERAAIEAADRLSPADKAALMSVRRYRENAEAFSGNGAQAIRVGPPASWLEWLKRTNAEGGWPEAQAIAARGVNEWAFPASAASELVRALRDPKSDGAEQTIQDAIPHLVLALKKDPSWPQREGRDLYQALLEFLAGGSDGASEDLLVAADLAEASLDSGLPKAGYHEVIEALRAVWTRAGGAFVLDRGLDLAELLIARPCPAPEERLRFLTEIRQSFDVFASRVTPSQAVLFRQLCAEAGTPELAKEVEEAATPDKGDDVLDHLNGRVVAIYSLDSGMAERAGKVLRTHTKDVEVIGGAVASKRLEEYARNADVFAVVTGRATHAATACIRKFRAQGALTIWCNGRGTASLIRDLEKAVGGI